MKVVIYMGQAAIFLLGKEVVLVPAADWLKLPFGSEQVDGSGAAGSFYFESSRMRSGEDFPGGREGWDGVGALLWLGC